MKFSTASFRSKIGKTALLAVPAALVASSATAQYTPPTLDSITFPLDTASIALAIGTAGAGILLLVFGWKVGFKLVNKLMRRMTSGI